MYTSTPTDKPWTVPMLAQAKREGRRLVMLTAYDASFARTLDAAGTDLIRVTGHVAPGAHGEVIYTMPATSIRHLPVVDVEVLLTTYSDGEERTIGSYTLVHGGSLQR